MVMMMMMEAVVTEIILAPQSVPMHDGANGKGETDADVRATPGPTAGRGGRQVAGQSLSSTSADGFMSHQ